MKESVTFYGHTFSSMGISASQEKISAILNAETRKSATEVRSFLGMCQYLARFIPNYSTLVIPLQKLTHQDIKWQWDIREQQALDDLKSTITKATTMHYFDIKQKTELVVDASPVG